MNEIRPLAELEREAIIAAVSAVPDKLQAARILGIGKTTLYRKLQELGATTSRSDRTPRIQSKPLGELALTTVLLRQAAVLRNIPIRALPERKPLRFLQIPSTRLEQEQASLRCPKCQTPLIDAVSA